MARPMFWGGLGAPDGSAAGVVAGHGQDEHPVAPCPKTVQKDGPLWGGVALAFLLQAETTPCVESAEGPVVPGPSMLSRFHHQSVGGWNRRQKKWAPTSRSCPR